MISAIIVCGGKGKRMGTKIPKQFLKIKKMEIFMYSVKVFQKLKEIKKIIVVVPKNYVRLTQKILKKYKVENGAVIEGGKERFNSVYNGLLEAKGSSIVLVHDGVRPVITRSLIKRVLKGAVKYGACIPVIPVNETLKRISKDEIKTLNRNEHFLSQTPQGFKYDLLLKAYNNVIKNGIKITDEAMAVELLGHPVRVVEGDRKNIKITYKEDLKIAETYIKNLKWM
jgi:2-C-methyl-D-erythritol 4-phosphate cytidylyltransferase